MHEAVIAPWAHALYKLLVPACSLTLAERKGMYFVQLMYSRLRNKGQCRVVIVRNKEGQCRVVIVDGDAM